MRLYQAALFIAFCLVGVEMNHRITKKGVEDIQSLHGVMRVCLKSQ
jgi:hypothetical protein